MSYFECSSIFNRSDWEIKIRWLMNICAILKHRTSSNSKFLNRPRPTKANKKVHDNVISVNKSRTANRRNIRKGISFRYCLAKKTSPFAITELLKLLELPELHWEDIAPPFSSSHIISVHFQMALEEPRGLFHFLEFNGSWKWFRSFRN